MTSGEYPDHRFPTFSAKDLDYAWRWQATLELTPLGAPGSGSLAEVMGAFGSLIFTSGIRVFEDK